MRQRREQLITIEFKLSHQSIKPFLPISLMQVYIETYGCSSSKNDSEIMAGLLEKAGHIIIENIDNADAIIINTCIVKSVTEQKIISRIKKVQQD